MNPTDEDVQKLIGLLGTGKVAPISRRAAKDDYEKKSATRQRLAKLAKAVDSVAISRSQETESFSKREKYIAIGELRSKGSSWDEIADLFGYSSAKEALASYRRWVEKYAVAETIDEVRRVHNARLEEMYEALLPSIDRADSHTPRAVEVAIKLLERQARLYGADAVEEASTHKGGNQQQAVVINITAHPGDQLANQLIEGGSGEMGGGEGISEILPSSSPGLPEPKENNLFGGRNGLGEDLVRSLLDSQKTGEAAE